MFLVDVSSGDLQQTGWSLEVSTNRAARSGGGELVGGLKRKKRGGRRWQTALSHQLQTGKLHQSIKLASYAACSFSFLYPNTTLASSQTLHGFLFKTDSLPVYPGLGSAWISLSPVVTNALSSVPEQLGGGCYNRLPQRHIAGEGISARSHRGC